MNQENKEDNKQPHYLGHRKRLKEKFLNSDPSSVNDYELLELLLFQAVPRRDVKPLAKELLQKFGNFNQLINAESNNKCYATTTWSFFVVNSSCTWCINHSVFWE